MPTTEELKKNFLTFKNELKKLEEYRLETVEPLKIPRNLIPVCSILFIFYVIMLVFSVYVFPMPFFKAHPNSFLMGFSLIITSSAPFIMPLLLVIGAICKSIEYFRKKDYFMFAEGIFKRSLLGVYFKSPFYNPKYQLSDEEMNVFGKLLPQHISIKTEECQGGFFDDMKIKMCETFLTNIVNQEKTEIFKGLCVVVEMPEHFKGETFIYPKGLISVSEIPRVIHDSIEFNKLYDTFSSEHIEVKKLFTQIFLEKYIKWSKKFSGSPLTMALVKGKIFIVLNTGRKEFNLLKTLYAPLNFDEIKTVLGDIQDILNLVNLVKIYRKFQD